MSFAAGFAAGYAFAKKMFQGSGGSDIYITDYSDTSLTVTTITGRGGETPKTTDHTFTFTTKEFKYDTNMVSATQQIKHTWSKTVITSVMDADNNVIWQLDPDSSGTIVSVYDSNGNEILDGITNGDSVMSNTPEGVALGFALAYSKEQDDLMEKLLNAYKQGSEDQKEIDDDESTIETIDLDGNGAKYYAIDANGKYQYYDCEYVQILAVNSSGKPTKVLIKNATYSYRQKANGKVELDEVYDPPKDFTLTTSMWLIADAQTTKLGGTVYDADGNEYTGNMILSF